VTDSANLDLARSIFAAWERGDFSSAEWAHPGIEWVLADGPSPGSWTGVSAMTESSRSWISTWQDYRVGAYEYRQLDEDRVLVLFHYGGRGKTSGLELGELQAKGAALLHIQGGKVTRAVHYIDREHALADLGLAADAEAPPA
jgi:ketosteroid isomerase-like protein